MSNKETTVVRQSTRHHLTNEDNFDQAFLTTTKEINTQMTFITSKEQANIALTLKLRKEGKITTLGALFKASIKQEVNSLTG